MKIQDIKTPGFIKEPRLMGEQTGVEQTGVGEIHYSSDLVGEGSIANYFFVGSDLYHYDTNSEQWYKYDKNSQSYTSSAAPFRN